jgi:hypothetical protein
MKKLEKIIKEAILEVLAEDAALDKAAQAAELNALNKKIAALNAQKSAVASGKDSVTEMARVPVQYKIADLSKLDTLSDKVKNSKGVQGIISYLQDKGQAPVALIAKDQFDRPQQAINPVVLALTQAGVLDTVAGSGIAPSRVGKGGVIAPPTTDDSFDAEDFFIGGKMQGKDFTFSKGAATSEDEEAEKYLKTLKPDAPVIKASISDEEYAKMMKFFDLKDRLKNVESNIRQNRKIGKGGSDIAVVDRGEEATLKNKKAELEKSLDDLVASSPYLQRRIAPESTKKAK